MLVVFFLSKIIVRGEILVVESLEVDGFEVARSLDVDKIKVRSFNWYENSLLAKLALNFSKISLAKTLQTWKISRLNRDIPLQI